MLITRFKLGILLVLQAVPHGLACPGELPGNATGKFPFTIPGDDTASDIVTTGYVFNHMSLNVRNLTKSMEFYSKVFGFRLLFNYRATKKLSIAYMGHSHGGKNGSAYQTASELNRNKNNVEGLLELVHYENPAANLVPPTKVTNTLSHLGIVVPDINATQTRLDGLNIRIMKRLGEPMKVTGENGPELATAYGLGGVYELDPAEADEIVAALVPTGTDGFIMCLDPDGNLIEIQPQDLVQLGV